MACPERGHAAFFFQAQFQCFQRQLHVDLARKQLFSYPGIGCIAQQSVFQMFGVYPADIGLFDQSATVGDVIGSQPSWQRPPQAVVQAECALGPSDQVFQGQLCEVRGDAFDDTDGPWQAGRGQKSQLNIIGCKVIHTLLHGERLFELAPVGAHLPLQHVGGISVDVADAIQVSLACTGLSDFIQGKAVMAVECDFARGRVFEPLGEVFLDRCETL